MKIRNAVRVLVRLLVPALLATLAGAQAGWVRDAQKISQTEGGFTGTLASWDLFGRAAAAIGDLDGDGVGDLAVGAPNANDGGFDRGAVWILFLEADGSVKSHQKISQTAGGFGGALENYDLFGHAVANLGDLDGDGVTDLAVGAPGNRATFGAYRGAVWILFLHSDGTVKAEHEIDNAHGTFGLVLGGESLAPLGDLDGDGVVDLAVGAPRELGSVYMQWKGAVWILFLNADGTVRDFMLIGHETGTYPGTLNNFDMFGWSVTSLDDFNGDGVTDLAVGVPRDDTGGEDRGAVWILFLRPDGTVLWGQKIADGVGGFTGELRTDANFGSAVAPVGDLDGDGFTDLAIGTPGDNDRADGGAPQGPRGAVWIAFLEATGTVRALQKISDVAGGFGGNLDDGDGFGMSLASSGGQPMNLIAGVAYDDDGGAGTQSNVGAFYLLDLQDCPAASASFRNPDVGGVTNPPVYDVVASPTMDGDFIASVATTGKLGCFLIAYASPLTLGTTLGNLLVDPTDPGGELSGRPIALGDPAWFTLPIPDDPALCGFTCATQAVRFGGGIDLTNAQDLVLGR